MKKLGLLSLGVAVLFSFGSLSQSCAAPVGPAEKIAAAAENPMIVKVAAENRKQVAAIANMGFDVAEAKNGFVTIVATKTCLKKLDNKGFRYTITNPDANSMLSRFRAGAALGRYHSYEQVQKILKDAEANNPDICRVDVIGKSCEGRDIYALNITGKGRGRKKPAALFMGLHHSREWISVEVPLSLIDELVTKYRKDENIKKLVDGRDIWVVPVVNPDGLTYSQTKSKMWRKNRRLNSDKTYGVDPNRNYGYEWGDVGSSDTPGDDTYHGPKAFSEPCTQAIKKLAEEHNFVGDITFHSYSELILYPYSYAYEAYAKDDKLFAQLAADMAKFNGYTAQKSSDLYPSMGDTDDFMYGAHGSLSFTFELGSTFIPADAQVQKICDDNVKACLYLLDRIGSTHASTHPDYASKVAVAVSRYIYAAGVSNMKDGTAKTELINILNPANDADAKNLDEFVAEAGKSDRNSKLLLLPVLKEVKDMYMNSILDKGGNTRQTIRNIEKLQAEIGRIE